MADAGNDESAKDDAWQARKTAPDPADRTSKDTDPPKRHSESDIGDPPKNTQKDQAEPEMAAVRSQDGDGAPASIPSFGSEQIAPQSRTQDDQAAVAGTRREADPHIYDLEWFRMFDRWTSNYKQHSIALKWFRDSKEMIGEDCMRFGNNIEHLVPDIVHQRGTAYDFDEGNMHKWTWKEMVAQMDDASMRVVVEGPDPQNRSRGLVSCRLQKTDRYDHKRHAALGAAAGMGRMLKQWDFIMDRDDGSCISLHPNYSSARI